MWFNQIHKTEKNQTFRGTVVCLIQLEWIVLIVRMMQASENSCCFNYYLPFETYLRFVFLFQKKNSVSAHGLSFTPSKWNERMHSIPRTHYPFSNKFHSPNLLPYVRIDTPTQYVLRQLGDVYVFPKIYDTHMRFL